MVYTERTDKCSAKNSSASDSQKSTKGSYGSAAPQASKASTAWSKTASNEDKWKFNRMVSEDRKQFNSLHFC